VLAAADDDAGADRAESPAAAEGRELVERIADAIGVACRVDAREDEDAIRLTCGSADPARLIGKHGQTLDAIQYLVHAILRHGGVEGKEVVVDAAGYRERRRATLETLAVRSAQRALREGRVELEPMTPPERKIVHLRLKDFPGVATSSEGAEPGRYIVITALDG
jgi:spoIIIJ-associated protein